MYTTLFQKENVNNQVHQTVKKNHQILKAFQEKSKIALISSKEYQRYKEILVPRKNNLTQEAQSKIETQNKVLAQNLHKKHKSDTNLKLSGFIVGKKPKQIMPCVQFQNDGKAFHSQTLSDFTYNPPQNPNFHSSLPTNGYQTNKIFNQKLKENQKQNQPETSSLAQPILEDTRKPHNKKLQLYEGLLSQQLKLLKNAISKQTFDDQYLSEVNQYEQQKNLEKAILEKNQLQNEVQEYTSQIRRNSIQNLSRNNKQAQSAAINEFKLRWNRIENQYSLDFKNYDIPSTIIKNDYNPDNSEPLQINKKLIDDLDREVSDLVAKPIRNRNLTTGQLKQISNLFEIKEEDNELYS